MIPIGWACGRLLIKHCLLILIGYRCGGLFWTLFLLWKVKNSRLVRLCLSSIRVKWQTKVIYEEENWWVFSLLYIYQRWDTLCTLLFSSSLSLVHSYHVIQQSLLDFSSLVIGDPPESDGDWSVTLSFGATRGPCSRGREIMEIITPSYIQNFLVSGNLYTFKFKEEVSLRLNF